MNFDDAITDIDRPLIDPDEDWLPRTERSEPDLAVDGLSTPLIARLWEIVSGRRP